MKSRFLAGKAITAAVAQSQQTNEGWQPITTAPRDGTVVETKCTYGVLPWYGLHRWMNGGWRDASNDRSGVMEGPHLFWRPYAGAVESYVDPTNGAQSEALYWLTGAELERCGVKK